MSETSRLSNGAKDEAFKILGYVTVILTFLALIKTVYYYNKYSISILNYINWDEFLLIAFHDLISSIFIFLMLNYFILVKNNVLLVQSKVLFSKRILTWIVAAHLIVIPPSIVIELVTATIGFNTNILYDYSCFFPGHHHLVSRYLGFYVLIFLPVLFYIVSHIEVQIFFMRILPEKDYKLYNVFISFCVFMAYMEIATVINDIYKVINNYNYGSTFETEKKRFIVDDNFVYLGRTKEYIFFKHYEGDSITVVPRVQIIQENLKTNMKRTVVLRAN